MNIKTMTMVELKALAYEQLVSLEQSQNNLKIINQEIASRTPTMSMPTESMPEENKVDKKEEKREEKKEYKKDKKK
jgi:hypothetical protein